MLIKLYNKVVAKVLTLIKGDQSNKDKIYPSIFNKYLDLDTVMDENIMIYIIRFDDMTKKYTARYMKFKYHN